MSDAPDLRKRSFRILVRRRRVVARTETPPLRRGCMACRQRCSARRVDSARDGTVPVRRRGQQCDERGLGPENVSAREPRYAGKWETQLSRQGKISLPKEVAPRRITRRSGESRPAALCAGIEEAWRTKTARPQSSGVQEFTVEWRVLARPLVTAIAVATNVSLFHSLDAPPYVNSEDASVPTWLDQAFILGNGGWGCNPSSSMHVSALLQDPVDPDFRGHVVDTEMVGPLGDLPVERIVRLELEIQESVSVALVCATPRVVVRRRLEVGTAE